MPDLDVTDVDLGRVAVRTYRDKWRAPMARYAVHLPGMAPVKTRTLAEAKAWVVEHFGPVRWERRTFPNGRETGAEWIPTVKAA